MGIELKDFRAKITPESDAVLEGISRATGQDRAEIARAVLHEWALKQIHAATVTHKLLQAEGLAGIDGGMRGQTRECKGTCGSACPARQA